MIQMKYKDLLHPRLQPVLGKVANTPMDPTQSYEVNKLLAKIREEIAKTRKESSELLKNFVKFDGDKPAFKESENEDKMPEVEFIAPYSAVHPDYVKAFEDFEQKDAKIDFRPWSLQMLAQNGVKLSAMEIDLLGPLLTDKPFLQAVEEKYN
jgi:hypothetical protein